MNLHFTPFFLEFKTPFGISKLTRKGTDTIQVSIHQNSFIGYGEAVLPPYLKEQPNEIINLLNQTVLPDFKTFSLLEIDSILSQLPSSPVQNPCYYAAVDMALHDLLGKIKKKSIKELYNIKSQHQAPSSFTIGFSSKDEIAMKLKDAENFSLIKLKLGGNNDFETITEIKRLSSLPIAADLNQAWQTPDLKLIDVLEQSNCQYLEEPCQDVDALKNIKTSISIIADESFQGIESFKSLAPEFNGINIKLMKCGGLREAYKIINEAKKRKLKILLGCMSGSSCAISAMSHFSPLANWIDLDGPALIANDPFSGLSYQAGKIILENPYGLGISKRY